MKIALLGPVSAWWGDMWETPEHWAYVEWRQQVHDALVAADHLVYRPDMGFKGKWTGNEDAQIVNDTAIHVCDLELNLTPPGVRSVGTEDEMLLCERLGKVVLPAPPDTAPGATDRLLARIDAVTAEELAAGARTREDDVLVSRALLADLIESLETIHGPLTMDYDQSDPAMDVIARLRTAARHTSTYAPA